MPGAANSSSASASGGGSVLARAWNYVFGLVEEDEGYGSEGEDGLVGPIGGREEGEDTDPNEWVPAQWGPYARAAGPPLGNASGGGRSGEEGGDRDGRGILPRPLQRRYSIDSLNSSPFQIHYKGITITSPTLTAEHFTRDSKKRGDGFGHSLSSKNPEF